MLAAVPKIATPIPSIYCGELPSIPDLRLTLLENWLEQRARVEPYRGGFLLHYMGKRVYPEISATVLTVVGALVCALNLALYGRRM